MIAEIWNSFRSLPGWVQVWVALVLVPVNAAAIFFVGQPLGGWVAALAIGGMLPNAALILIERGFSKAMSLSHILLWVPLVVIIGILLNGADTAIVTGGYRGFLWMLLTVNLISLVFDVLDAAKWLGGDRAVAG